MKAAFALATALALATAPASAAGRTSVSGDYVEARTAEVFTGGCIMGSEAETVGRHAVLAWRIAEGSFEGVPLGGLSVVAALSADRNLGIREIGGEAPTVVKTAVLVDERADEVQRAALVAFVRTATNGLAGRVVDVRAAPITFERHGDLVRVSADEATLAVQTSVRHEMSCGAMQWFHPLATVETAAVGMTKAQTYSGRALGSRWQQYDKKSSFIGTFSYSAVE